MKGKFISFEGPDGAGKTTQVKKLAEYLMYAGYDVVVTREPGGTPISDQIRGLILSPDHQEMADQAEVLLYAASRAQHVHELILPALEEGKIVISDRYIDASVAYQAYGLGIDLDAVISINRFASSGLQPDRTYMLDLSVEASRERLQSRTAGNGMQGLDRIEQKGAAYHQRVREGFHRIAARETERIVVIDADRTAEEMAKQIIGDCEQFFKPFPMRNAL